VITHRAGELLAAVNDAVSDGADFLGMLQRPVGARQGLEDQGHAFLMVGDLPFQPADFVGVVMFESRVALPDPLDQPLRDDAFLRHLVELVLDG
jgi:hypothetical protein